MVQFGTWKRGLKHDCCEFNVVLILFGTVQWNKRLVVIVLGRISFAFFSLWLWAIVDSPAIHQSRNYFKIPHGVQTGLEQCMGGGSGRKGEKFSIHALNISALQPFSGIQPREEIWKRQSDPEICRCFDEALRLPQQDAYGLWDCAILLTLLPALLFWRAESWCHSLRFSPLWWGHYLCGRQGPGSPGAAAHWLGSWPVQVPSCASSASCLCLLPVGREHLPQAPSLLLVLMATGGCCQAWVSQGSWMVPRKRMLSLSPSGDEDDSIWLVEDHSSHIFKQADCDQKTVRQHCTPPLPVR